MPHAIQKLIMRWDGSSYEAHAPSTSLRLEHLLKMVDWRPPGMPPGAILLIQRLDNLPPLHNIMDGDLGMLLAWEAHLRERIARLYKRAERPQHGPVRANAISVLFENPAEMMICLVREVLQTAPFAPSSWYWYQVADSGAYLSGGALLTAVWMRHAAFLPAALSKLTVQETFRAAALLREDEVLQVLEALCAAFSLVQPQLPAPAGPIQQTGQAGDGYSANPRIARSPPGPSWDVERQHGGIAATGGKASGEQRRRRTGATGDKIRVGGTALSAGAVQADVVAPWSAWLPAMPNGLSPGAQVLLGWCAALNRAPVVARSPQFAVQVATWLSSARLDISLDDPRPLTHDTLNPTISRDPVLDPAPGSTTHETHQTKTIPASPIDPVRQDSIPRQPSWDVLFGDEMPEIDGVTTEWGGVLFLVHVLRWLDLPAQWDDRLSSWACLEALAWALLDHDAGGDPIWDILAVLDRRTPEDRVGADLRVRKSFRLPAPWVQRYVSDAHWRAFATDDRLLIADTARGFLVADVALSPGDEGMDVLTRELSVYRTSGCEVECEITTDPLRFEDVCPALSPSAHNRMADKACWWLRRAVGFIRWLLRAHLREPALDPASLANLVLQRSGMLVVSMTHIDLHFPLDGADIRLRRSGLDQDPGWVPELGYIVMFHFDS